MPNCQGRNLSFTNEAVVFKFQPSSQYVAANLFQKKKSSWIVSVCGWTPRSSKAFFFRSSSSSIFTCCSRCISKISSIETCSKSWWFSLSRSWKKNYIMPFKLQRYLLILWGNGIRFFLFRVQHFTCMRICLITIWSRKWLRLNLKNSETNYIKEKKERTN